MSHKIEKCKYTDQSFLNNKTLLELDNSRQDITNCLNEHSYTTVLFISTFLCFTRNVFGLNNIKQELTYLFLQQNF